MVCCHFEFLVGFHVPLNDVAVVVARHQELVQGSPQDGRHLGPRTGDSDAKDGCGLCRNIDNRY